MLYDDTTPKGVTVGGSTQRSRRSNGRFVVSVFVIGLLVFTAIMLIRNPGNRPAAPVQPTSSPATTIVVIPEVQAIVTIDGRDYTCGEFFNPPNAEKCLPKREAEFALWGSGIPAFIKVKGLQPFYAAGLKTPELVILGFAACQAIADGTSWADFAKGLRVKQYPNIKPSTFYVLYSAADSHLC